MGRLALVDKTPEKVSKIDVEWVDKSPGFVPKNYGLLLGEKSAHPNLVAVGNKDDTARYEPA